MEHSNRRKKNGLKITQRGGVASARAGKGFEEEGKREIIQKEGRRGLPVGPVKGFVKRVTCVSSILESKGIPTALEKRKGNGLTQGS